MALDLGCLRVPSALQTSICKRRRAEPPPVAAPKCEEASRLGKLMGRKDKC